MQYPLSWKSKGEIKVSAEIIIYFTGYSYSFLVNAQIFNIPAADLLSIRSESAIASSLVLLDVIQVFQIGT